MKKKIFSACVFALVILGAAAGLRAQALVTVADTLRSPSGTLLRGTITITNNATFTAADGTIVPKGTVARANVIDGAFSVALVPNVGSTPSGSSYEASYQLGSIYLNETWVVPSSGPATLADVRTSPTPAVSAILAASQMPALTGDVNSSAGSTSTSVVQLHWGSTALSLPFGSAPADGQCLTRSGFTITGIACGNNPAAAGVANWTGSDWGTPYQVGTSPNNLVQLDSTGKLPAVDGSQLTNLPLPVVTISTSGPVTVSSTGFYINNASGAITYNLPAVSSSNTGAQFCFRNNTGKTGAITLQSPASTFIDVSGANGSSAGTLVSGGALGDAACVVAISSTEYFAYIGTGTWTNN